MIKPGAPVFAETVSPVPVAKPLNLRIPSQTEKIMAYIRYEQMRAAQSQEIETFEEADDFEFEDGEQWFSPYEEIFEPEPEPAPVAAPAATQTASPAPAPPERPQQ